MPRFCVWRKGAKAGEGKAGNVCREPRDDRRRRAVRDGEAKAGCGESEREDRPRLVRDDLPNRSRMKREAWEGREGENKTGAERARRPSGTTCRAGPVGRFASEFRRPKERVRG